MQSALLSPPNWLFLILPLPLAVNWSIALNLWLLGALTYLWASRRGLHPFAAFVSGALAMFCAPTFLHVMAGHPANLSSMAWIPLQFLAIDEWLARRKPAWCLVGMLAIAMQIFGGHPQYVYFAGIASGVYALMRLAEPQQKRLLALAGLLSIPVGGALLAAVQLLAGVQAVEETVRALPLPIWFAGSFSLPPENLVTLLAPGFFGDFSWSCLLGQMVSVGGMPVRRCHRPRAGELRDMGGARDGETGAPDNACGQHRSGVRGILPSLPDPVRLGSALRQVSWLRQIHFSGCAHARPVRRLRTGSHSA